jgi:DNA-binding response OmpR family regulator
MAAETILIIENDPQIVEFLEQDILVPQDYMVLVASDTKSAIEKALIFTPDLILFALTDLQLADHQILNDLRKTILQAPVIYMVSGEVNAIPINSLRLGVRGYLKKPLSAGEVNQVIESTLHDARVLHEQEKLIFNPNAIDTVHTTIVTLSHYLNNYLTILKGNLTLLEESLVQDQPELDLNQLIQDSRYSVMNIQAVIQVLLRASKVELSSYSDTTPMINIQNSLGYGGIKPGYEE